MTVLGRANLTRTGRFRWPCAVPGLCPSRGGWGTCFEMISSGPSAVIVGRPPRSSLLWHFPHPEAFFLVEVRKNAQPCVAAKLNRRAAAKRALMGWKCGNFFRGLVRDLRLVPDGQCPLGHRRRVEARRWTWSSYPPSRPRFSSKAAPEGAASYIGVRREALRMSTGLQPLRWDERRRPDTRSRRCLFGVSLPITGGLDRDLGRDRGLSACHGCQTAWAEPVPVPAAAARDC